MKFTYTKLNNVLGWLVFLIASVTYLLTIEPNISFWDTGEYIASAAKLEVTHSPGAAFFQLVGAVFAGLSFGNGAVYPILINAMNAVISGLTILLTFWSITYFMTKTLALNENFSKDTQANKVIIFAAGIIGSLAFTFSDTFWYSAVEGEVYAMASLFIALLIWIISKWDREEDETYSSRWLVLIAFIIGLSVGVHMMVLLAVPAVCYIYYAKKGALTLKSFLIANGITLVILAFVFKFIFPFIMSYFWGFEKFFVNEIGLPFNSGSFIALLFLAVVFFFAIRITRIKNLPLINLGVWSVMFMLVGFTCWMTIPIRANANPPMNLNNPDNAIGMKDYYNREQYGDWPIFYGAHYTAYLDKDGIENSENTDPIYLKNEDTGKYEISGHHFKYVFNKKHVGLFPRMYYPSNDTGVQEQYGMRWGYPKIKINPEYAGEPQVENLINELKEAQKTGDIEISDYQKYAEYITIQKPSIAQNLKYLAEYQIGQMFVRYLGWNFVGKQNDKEWRYDSFKGNMEDGIISNSKNLPEQYTNKGTNHYYFLPLILGLIGLFFQLNKDFKRFYALLSLFLLAGIGIVLYTNMKPFEPRERDYAVVGSFYVFAIWIGLGAGAILHFLQTKVKQVPALVGVSAILLTVPLLMAFQNWDDHDRSHRNTAFDQAYSYLKPLEKNSILFVYGDNDTYPLWGVQETAQLRDDVKVVNYTLLGTSWYISQVHRKTYNADKIPSSLQFSEYKESVNDAIKLFSKEEWGEGFFENENINEYLKQGGLDISMFSEFKQYLEKDSMTAKEAIAFIKKPVVKKDGREEIITAKGRLLNLFFGDNFKEYNMLPVSKISIPVNKANCLKYGIVSAQDADKIPEYITLDLSPIAAKAGGFRKAELAMLDMFAHYNWDRPIYLSSGAIMDPTSTFMLSEYTEYLGFVYKVVPFKNQRNEVGEYGNVNALELYKTIKQFKWGNFKDPKAHFDETGLNNIIQYRQAVGRAAKALHAIGENKKAKELLDLCMTEIPVEMYPGSPSLDDIIHGYILIGDEKKALELANTYQNSLLEEYAYYEKMTPSQQKRVSNRSGRVVAYYAFTSESIAQAYLAKNQPEKAKDYIAKALSVWNKKFDSIIQKVETKGTQELDKQENNISTIFQAYGTILNSMEKVDSTFVLEKQLQLEMKMSQLEKAAGGF